METVTKKPRQKKTKSVVPAPEYVIIDKQSRSKLGEGRSHGMGFAFLEKKEDGFHTVQPISPCKDYLNDVVWSEAVNRPVHAYGCSYRKQDIFRDGVGYLAAAICSFRNGTSYNQMQRDVQALRENVSNWQVFIQYFEEVLKLETRTEIIPCDGDRVLIKVPLFWCKYTYLISLYTLLLRVGVYWEGTIEPLKYLDPFTINAEDTYLIAGILPKLKKILGGTLPEQNMEQLMGETDVHNYGILTMKI